MHFFVITSIKIVNNHILIATILEFMFSFIYVDGFISIWMRLEFKFDFYLLESMNVMLVSES